MTGAIVEIGDNLLSAIMQIVTLLMAIFAGGAAHAANRRARDAYAQTQPNGGTSMRDDVRAARAAAESAAVSAEDSGRAAKIIAQHLAQSE